MTLTTIYVIVALDSRQAQFRARPASVIDGVGPPTIVRARLYEGTVVLVDRDEEGLTWCRWGQRRVMDALEATLALRGPPSQYTTTNATVVVMADPLDTGTI